MTTARMTVSLHPANPDTETIMSTLSAGMNGSLVTGRAKVSDRGRTDGADMDIPVSHRGLHTSLAERSRSAGDRAGAHDSTLGGVIEARGPRVHAHR